MAYSRSESALPNQHRGGVIRRERSSREDHLQVLGQLCFHEGECLYQLGVILVRPAMCREEQKWPRYSHARQQRLALRRGHLSPNMSTRNDPHRGHLFQRYAVLPVNVLSGELRDADDVLCPRRGLAIQPFALLPLGLREKFRIVNMLQVVDGQDSGESDQIRVGVTADRVYEIEIQPVVFGQGAHRRRQHRKHSEALRKAVGEKGLEDFHAAFHGIRIIQTHLERGRELPLGTRAARRKQAIFVLPIELGNRRYQFVGRLLHPARFSQFHPAKVVQHFEGARLLDGDGPFDQGLEAGGGGSNRIVGLHVLLGSRHDRQGFANPVRRPSTPVPRRRPVHPQARNERHRSPPFPRRPWSYRPRARTWTRLRISSAVPRRRSASGPHRRLRSRNTAGCPARSRAFRTERSA